MRRALAILNGMLVAAAYGVLLAHLKPVPQALGIAFVLAGYLWVRREDGVAQRPVFLVIAGTAAACGVSYVCAEGLARLSTHWAERGAGRTMATGPLLLGAAFGLALAAGIFAATLRSLALEPNKRRLTLALISGVALLAVATDRLF